MLGWKPKSFDPTVASVRYRCMIPLRELQSVNFPVELFDSQKADSYQGVIFSKCYEPSDQDLARRLRSRGASVVLDLCDNHFYNPFSLPAYVKARNNLLEMIGLADVIVCSTPTLADTVTAEAALGEPPEVVGDPVEFPDVQPCANRTGERSCHKLMWFGIHGSPNAPCGMRDILAIADVLRDVFQTAKGIVELVVCSNSREEYDRSIAPLKIASSYVDYSVEEFPGLLSGMDGVILPVNRNPFTWAKSHNRLTTALFAGIPVVADAVPSYQEFAEFCSLEDWSSGLRELLFDPVKAQQKALAGRDYIMQRWMPRNVAERWLQVLSRLPGVAFPV